MDMKVIKSEPEYRSALLELERLIDLEPDPGEEDADRLAFLALLIEGYETKH